MDDDEVLYSAYIHIIETCYYYYYYLHRSPSDPLGLTVQSGWCWFAVSGDAAGRGVGMPHHWLIREASSVIHEHLAREHRLKAAPIQSQANRHSYQARISGRRIL